MGRRATSQGRRAAAMALAALTCALVGCGFGVDQDQPKRARVIIDSPDVGDAVVVISVDFDFNADGSVDLGSGTTEQVILPYEGTFDLIRPARFLVRVSRPDADSDGELHMLVFLDGESWYDHTDMVGPTGTEFMQFLYGFVVPRL